LAVTRAPLVEILLATSDKESPAAIETLAGAPAPTPIERVPLMPSGLVLEDCVVDCVRCSCATAKTLTVNVPPVDVPAAVAPTDESDEVAEIELNVVLFDRSRAAI
jgi:hypothetical protein